MAENFTSFNSRTTGTTQTKDTDVQILLKNS